MGFIRPNEAAAVFIIAAAYLRMANRDDCSTMWYDAELIQKGD